MVLADCLLQPSIKGLVCQLQDHSRNRHTVYCTANSRWNCIILAWYSSRAPTHFMPQSSVTVEVRLVPDGSCGVRNIARVLLPFENEIFI